MLNLFSDHGRPNPILDFIKKYDPIRRWAYDHELPESAPYWLKRLYADLITAVVRECYEEGIIATIRDLSTYDVVIGDLFFILAGEFHSSYTEYQHPMITRYEDSQRQAEAFDKARAGEKANPRPPCDPDVQAAIALMVDVGADTDKLLSPAKFYTLDLLMWKLWRAVPEAERANMFHSMWEKAWIADEQIQPQIAALPYIVDHIVGDAEAIESDLYDIWPNEPKGIECAREMLEKWRSMGAGWLADIYEPQVNERAAKLNGPDDDPNLAEAA